MTTAEMVLSVIIVLLVIANICMYIAMKDEEKKSKYFNDTCCKFIIENTKLKKQLAEKTTEKSTDKKEE